jgi:hypothetical protein
MYTTDPNHVLFQQRRNMYSIMYFTIINAFYIN